MMHKSQYGRDVTKRAIIGVISIVSGRNYDILTSIIAQDGTPVAVWVSCIAISFRDVLDKCAITMVMYVFTALLDNL